MEALTGERSPLYKTYGGYMPVFVNAIGQVHQVPEGPYKGRYVLAGADYAAPDGEPLTENFRNHASVGSGVLYSDDRGETWRMDGLIADYLGNEASAVSLRGGKELLMIRTYMDVRQLDKKPGPVGAGPASRRAVS